MVLCSTAKPGAEAQPEEVTVVTVTIGVTVATAVGSAAAGAAATSVGGAAAGGGAGGGGAGVGDVTSVIASVQGGWFFNLWCLDVYSCANGTPD